MTKAATLKVRRVTAQDIASYFSLDSPGYFLARDAERVGEIAGAADAVEVIVLVNKLCEMALRERIVEELAARHGKAAARKYLEACGTVEGTDYVVQLLGKEVMKVILRAVMSDVKKESGVGSGNNTPTRAARRATKRRAGS